jgi:hypothetical protein
MADPPAGSMYLYDAMTPPLRAGDYRFVATAEARLGGSQGTQQVTDTRAFTVDAPRFNLPPNEVAGVFPPRNGHGPFEDSLPQMVLGRRTLPWERKLDSEGGLPAPNRPLDPPAPEPADAVPWLALLLFEESECTLLPQVPLTQVVPAGVYTRLGRPAGVFCDAVEARADLVDAILPSLDELQVLTHVRQVNVDDRELAAGDSDGWFAVVMGNRLPRSGAKHVACLVSLEERTDLVSSDPPEDFEDVDESIWTAEVDKAVLERFDLELEEARERQAAIQAVRRARFESAPGDLDDDDTAPRRSQMPGGGFALGGVALPVDQARFDLVLVEPVVRLVCLYSWRFECPSEGATFRELTRDLDVAMVGVTEVPGQPVVTDTGHLAVTVHDRAGATEASWYRGPLVPYPLTRDELGPYHSADQCRRVSPETGAEDISYAAAFEIGRLLAAADPRLAVELARWRRGAYDRSAQNGVVEVFDRELPSMILDDLRGYIDQAIVPVVTSSVIPRIVGTLGPLADRYGIDVVRDAPGLDPASVQAAWRLPSVELARAVLGEASGPVGGIGRQVIDVDPPAGMTTLEQVLGDGEGRDRLEGERAGAVARAVEQTGTGPEGGPR